ncbi:MAG: hypothetical protein C0404_01660 [Verrucomicrobia bacterium]|nr:hypothetical protein [Verrucomicrobiota bacterium]
MSKLGLWWSRRSALSGATDGEDPGAVVRFLAEHPEEDKRFADEAIAFCDGYATWSALMLSVGLVRSGSPEARRVILRLLAHSDDKTLSAEKPVPWQRLDADALKALHEYLLKNADHAEAKRFTMQLGGDQMALLLPDLDSPQFLDLLDHGVKQGTATNGLTKRIADMLDSSAASGSSPTPGQRNARRAVEMLMDANRRDEALELMTGLSLVAPSLMDQALLAKVAGHINETLTARKPQEPQEEGEEPAGAHEEIEQRAPSKADHMADITLLRAADILARFPSATWVPPLKSMWGRLMESLERDRHTEREHALPPVIAALGNTVALALGLAAAHDKSYTALEPAVTSSKELTELIAERNGKVMELRKLADEFRSKKGSTAADKELAERIRDLQFVVGSLDEQIAEMKFEEIRTFSPATMLMIVLRDDQSYRAEIRQGAAWGLYKLWELGNLDDDSRMRIADSIHHCVVDDDDEDIDRLVKETVGDDESLGKTLRDAANEYHHNGNLPKFVQAVHDMPLDEEKRHHIVVMMQSTRHESISHDFRERRVYLLPEHGRLEQERALQNGLAWMEDIEEDTEGDEDNEDAPYKQLRSILALLHDHMPQALTFLSHHPLRLMTLKQHQRLLGQFSKTRCHVSLWTRYTPPAWHRGMPEGTAGEVRRRYLDLDDRSGPNSMGIYSRLFRHPVLVLPVIYHEFMHYGGPEGDPSKGIENETEVLLREIVFARALVARLAPPEGDVSAYEQEIVHAIHSVGLDGLGMQMCCDLRNDDFFSALRDEITESYGRQTSDAEADETIDSLESWENRNIRLQNMTNPAKINWHPEIDWPSLDSQESQGLRADFRRVLKRGLMADHHLSRSDRDRILDTPPCAGWLKEWEKYCARPSALQTLRSEWNPQEIELEQILQRLISRVELPFALRAGPDPRSVQEVFRMLLERDKKKGKKE